MAIERQLGNIWLTCDECEEEESEACDEFDHMLRVAKNDGWLITKDDGEWKHIGPKCVGDTTVS